MKEEKRSFHKRRKWVCQKCGMVKFQKISKLKEIGDRELILLKSWGRGYTPAHQARIYSPHSFDTLSPVAEATALPL